MQRNPDHGKYREQTNGYEDCGWQMAGIKHPKVVACKALGHKMREMNNSLYRFHGENHVYICDECKILHHIYSSD